MPVASWLRSFSTISALSDQSGMSAVWSLLGEKQTLTGPVEIDANDPTATSAKVRCCSSEAALSPFQTVGLSRYDAVY